MSSSYLRSPALRKVLACVLLTSYQARHDMPEDNCIASSIAPGWPRFSRRCWGLEGGRMRACNQVSTTDNLCPTDFWGPVSNFGIPVAAIADAQKSPDLYVSPRRTLASAEAAFPVVLAIWISSTNTTTTKPLILCSKLSVTITLTIRLSLSLSPQIASPAK